MNEELLTAGAGAPDVPADGSAAPVGETLYAVLEAVLFAAGYPVPYDRLAAVTRQEEETLREAVCVLARRYAERGGGLQIVRYEDACQMCTVESYESYVREALGIRQGGKLSNSSLEVLAIVAYHQPVTRAQIERIRGVDSSYAVSSLVMKKLIEEKGRLDLPGRPVLFGTTDDFLRCFGFASLADLPDASEFLAETQTTFDELSEVASAADGALSQAPEGGNLSGNPGADEGGEASKEAEPMPTP